MRAFTLSIMRGGINNVLVRVKMNGLCCFVERVLGIDDRTVETQEVTTASIREKLGRRREDDAKSKVQLKEKQAKIVESLKLFPIELPASAIEIASCYNDWEFDILMQVTLEQLVQVDDSGWEYVNVDGCILYQKTK